MFLFYFTVVFLIGIVSSEWWLALENHPFAVGWMIEGESVGMEKKTFSPVAIESVAADGRVETGMMSTVNTQLVGASGERVEV